MAPKYCRLQVLAASSKRWRSGSYWPLAPALGAASTALCCLFFVSSLHGWGWAVSSAGLGADLPLAPPSK